MSIRVKVRRAMVARGVSIEMLSQLADVGRPNLSRWLNEYPTRSGKPVDLRGDAIERVFDALDIELRFKPRAEGRRTKAQREQPGWVKARSRPSPRGT